MVEVVARVRKGDVDEKPPSLQATHPEAGERRENRGIFGQGVRCIGLRDVWKERLLSVRTISIWVVPWVLGDIPLIQTSFLGLKGERAGRRGQAPGKSLINCR
jgi:hypothetical protein